MEVRSNFTSIPYGIHIKRKATSVKNPQASALLEHIHAFFTNMLGTAEINMADLVKASDIDIFLSDAAWTILSTYHTRLTSKFGHNPHNFCNVGVVVTFFQVTKWIAWVLS